MEVGLDGPARYLGETGDLIDATPHPVVEKDHATPGFAKSVHGAKDG